MQTFNPSASSTSGDIVASAFGTPSLSQANYSINNTNSNSYAPYARVARDYKDSALSADLLQVGMVISTFRDKKTTTLANRDKYEFAKYGRTPKGRLHVSRLANRHVMFDPVRLNFLLASTEPKAYSFDQQWSVYDVMDKWNFLDGIVNNQEGGPSRDGKNHNEKKEILLNMIVDGRAEGVLNVWGEHLSTDSELYFILKRCPLKTKDPTVEDKFYLDAGTRTRGYAGPSTSGIGQMPQPSEGIKIMAKRNAQNAGEGEEVGKYVSENPWQLCPFQPKGTRDRPHLKDTYGLDDFGHVVPGAILRLGRVWFPGKAPVTSTFVRHLEPLRDMGKYLSCGVITVIKDNHNDIYKR